MRLPWHRERIPAERFEEAHAMVEAAQGHLDEALARDSEVADLWARLRMIRERNHFSEGLAAMLQDSRHGHAPHA